MRPRFLLAALLLVSSVASAAPIKLRVDATGAPSNRLLAHLTIPATPGPMTLEYPKWIPGEHGPTGPIAGLTGMRISASGTPILWHRDPVDLFAIHLDVPANATSVDVDLEYLAPAPGANFTAGASTSPRLALLSWNTVLLYPLGSGSDSLQFEASLRIPQGWKYATALETKSSGEDLKFETVSLTTLVDSPVQMSAELKKIDIPSSTGLRHTLNLASESAAALVTPPEFPQQYSRLVEETTALFGANHYRHYDWLFTLSEQVAHFGLEHHESSDDRVGESTMREDASRKWVSTLLAHEFVHSWNGKYRRPAGLATGNFDQPMHGELLWVYEGLTNYLGGLLPVRSGLLTAEDYREHLASTAAAMTQHTGRTWRPLADTAVAAQLLYESPNAGSSSRRSVDFYPEGTLIWLDVDMTIRSLTGGKRSLDEFCRAFFGGVSGHPELKPYTLDDVVAALNAVAPHDWKGFLNQRLNSMDARPPLGGIEGSGWRLVYTDKSNTAIAPEETSGKNVNVMASLGLTVKENGSVADVIAESAAAKAGITPGSKLVAINGRRFSTRELRDALKSSMLTQSPIELIVESGEYFTTNRIDYHGGEKYPHLERIAGSPDLLEQLVKPIARAAKKK